MKGTLLLCVAIFMLMSCSNNRTDSSTSTLFELVSPDKSGVEFNNELVYDKDFNIYTYRNFYNGGGVAIGDINNDGLPDIYLTANMKSNRLYLNKGDFRFEDITEQAGVGGSKSWSTGVTMVDINADGFLDIYVCNSGDIKGDDRQNELFINNGNGTFEEQGALYGLNEKGLSTHAAFFDYDKDGDLDVYILNNSFRAIGSFDLMKNERVNRDSVGGHKLLRNDNGKFIDVSELANIYGSVIGFGLGVAISDFNQDSWPDIYVSNDFFERDYLYMNNGDGTFREDLPKQILSISMASMGVDAADLTGDGFPEIFVTEMLPKDESRLKTSMSFENWNKYKHNTDHDYHHQFTRNMLHLNNQMINGREVSFSEVGRQLGIEATDWSWSALIVDLDNNGFRDIHITNGIFKDILNQDYLRYISNDVVLKSMVTSEGINYKGLIDIIPSKPISNIVFSSNETLSFNDSTVSWGLDEKGFSNGAAYGDLDNDGDLDLVINNVNATASIYRNRAREKYPEHHYLKVKLAGLASNTCGIGARVEVNCEDKSYVLEQMPSRGFQSSVDISMLFGLGKQNSVDTLQITWPSGAIEKKVNVAVDQSLTLSESDASLPQAKISGNSFRTKTIFDDISSEFPTEFSHQEDKWTDFDNEPLLFHMNSTEGPRLAVADVNDDGLEDVFIGGAKNFAGKLLLQKRSGGWILSPQNVFEDDKRCEDVDALFFDADNDRDVDLYVVSGGNEYNVTSSALSDRLYLNDGKGNFSKSSQLLPTSRFESTSCVRSSDIDGDGDFDLFVGVRLQYRNYGLPQNGYILENDGRGKFTDVTSRLAPALNKLGLIRDACFADYDGDHVKDLVVVGEWMNIHVFKNNHGFFEDVTDKCGLSGTSGWWNRIIPYDLDNDGDVDFIAGNHGLNSRFKASIDKPVQCYIGDFDENGTIEQIICT